jgi:hypothetical protein
MILTDSTQIASNFLSVDCRRHLHRLQSEERRYQRRLHVVQLVPRVVKRAALGHAGSLRIGCCPRRDLICSSWRGVSSDGELDEGWRQAISIRSQATCHATRSTQFLWRCRRARTPMHCHLVALRSIRGRKATSKGENSSGGRHERSAFTCAARPSDATRLFTRS